ncbi:MAG: acyltransferase [Rhodospirillales bacterium]|nr:acyltransferase [Acetobacter sp.]
MNPAAATPDILAGASGRKTRHIPSLDGLRAASILIVLLGHGSGSIPLHGAGVDWVWVFLNDGHLGVTTFFVISGYLITYLLRREWEKTGGIDLGAFYVRRILRIFPAFYLFLGVVTLLVCIKAIPHTVTDLWLAATYTWNYRFFTQSWNPTVAFSPLEPHLGISGISGPSAWRSSSTCFGRRCCCGWA